MNGEDEHSGWVPRLVELTLERIKDERWALLSHRPSTPTEWAIRADRLAELCEREIGWWLVLARWTWRTPGADRAIMRRAAFEAAELRRQGAELWRGMATDWRARAAGEPVCSVVGRGCGVCEVPA